MSPKQTDEGQEAAQADTDRAVSEYFRRPPASKLTPKKTAHPSTGGAAVPMQKEGASPAQDGSFFFAKYRSVLCRSFRD